MKKLFFVFAIAIMTIASTQAQTKKSKAKSKAKAASATTQSKKEVVENLFKIDVDNTIIKWTGKKVAGSHFGKIKAENGTFRTNDGKLVNGNVVINMNTITCDDIEDKGKNDYLVGHLKNEDFFNVTSFPHAILDIKNVVLQKDGSYTINAYLSIKGHNLPINFSAKISNSGDQLKATTKFSFDRTKYEIKYGSGMIGTAQDKLINDDVELEITLVANKFK